MIGVRPTLGADAQRVPIISFDDMDKAWFKNQARVESYHLYVRPTRGAFASDGPEGGIGLLIALSAALKEFRGTDPSASIGSDREVLDPEETLRLLLEEYARARPT